MANNIVFLGDSIMQGWDGKASVASPIPTIIGTDLNVTTTNTAIGGARIYGSDTRDISNLVKSINFGDYQIAVIMAGTNDYNNSISSIKLTNIQSSLEATLSFIKTSNPSIKILGVTPIQSFDFNTSMNATMNGGFSQNDLDDMLISVYKDAGCTTLDWRDNPIVTPSNYGVMLGDYKIHPTQATMDKMAKAIEVPLQALMSAPDTVVSLALQHIGEPLDYEHFVKIMNSNIDVLNSSLPDVLEPLQEAYMSDNATFTQLIKFTGDKLNRAFYLWLNASLLVLQTNYQTLVDTFAGSDLADYVSDDSNLPTGSWWLPNSLAFSDLETGYNNDIDLLANAISQIQTNIQDFKLI